MQNKFKLLIVNFLMILSFGVSSCGNEKLADLSETIYIRRNGADMPARIFGNGSDKVFLIILHGGPGGDGFTYRLLDFAKNLEKHYALVYYDQRGQGMSQGHYSKDDVSVEEMVEDVGALAKVIKHKYGDDSQLFIMGHSWGGTLGSAVMITEKQHLFKGWIEVDGAHDIPQLNRALVRMIYEIGNDQIAQGNSSNFWLDAQKTASKVDTTKEDMDAFGDLNSIAHEAETHLEDADLINASDNKLSVAETFSALTSQTNGLTSLITGLSTQNILNEKGLETISLTDELYKIKIPTLLLWGRWDFVVPVDLGYSAYEKIGSTSKKLVIFEKSAHSPMANEPENFNAEVVNFIELHRE